MNPTEISPINPRPRPARRRWLPDMDLNHDKQIQSLLCYRYTIGQSRQTQPKSFARTVKFPRGRPCGLPRLSPQPSP
jgi:hypothetical protein